MTASTPNHRLIKLELVTPAPEATTGGPVLPTRPSLELRNEEASGSEYAPTEPAAPRPTPRASLAPSYQYFHLSAGVAIMPTELLGKRAATLYDPEYADCLIMIQGKPIMAHRTVVLSQSRYLRSQSSTAVDEETGMYVVEAQVAPSVPAEQMFLVAQGVLYCMYLMRPDSILQHTYPDWKEVVHRQPEFLSHTYILAGTWKAYFAMEVILSDICGIWQKMNLKLDNGARKRLCDGISALWGALSKQQDCADEANTFPPMATKVARDLCIEFVATWSDILQKSGDLDILTDRFPSLKSAIFSILTRESRKNPKCKRCDVTERREKARAIKADVDQVLCTICRAFEGKLDIEPRESPQGRTPKRPASSFADHQATPKKAKVRTPLSKKKTMNVKGSGSNDVPFDLT